MPSGCNDPDPGAALYLVDGETGGVWRDQNKHVAELKDINTREGLVLGSLAVLVLLLGIWPRHCWMLCIARLEHYCSKR